MSLQNTVADTMDCDDPSVYLFGWNGDNGDLTEERGQPVGESIGAMQLDSMRHAIIITRGEIDYQIHSILPARHVEFIIILGIPGAVFVSRYLPSCLLGESYTAIREELLKIGIGMKVKLEEIANKDGPHERSLPENAYVAIYYPEAVTTGTYGLETFEAFSNSVKQDFLSKKGIKFSASTYSRNETAVIVTVPPREGELATHASKPS
jgi:hypothetical protein